MECEIKLEAPATPDREAAADGDLGKGLLEDSEEVKKRKRKPYRPGEWFLTLSGPGREVPLCSY